MTIRILASTAMTVVMLTVSSGHAHAEQLPIRYAVDFPCADELFPNAGRMQAAKDKTKEGGAMVRGGLSKLYRAATGKAAQPPMIVALPQSNAVCQAEVMEDLLLLTGRMIDRAAYSAAKGVDAVQVALGRQRTFLVPIAELERALKGIGISDPNKTEIVIKETSAISRTLLVEVQQMKDTMRNDEAVQKNLRDAEDQLHQAEYYSVTAIVGGSLFGKRFAKASPKEKAQLALFSERVGLASDFAQTLPERAARVSNTATDSVALQEGISTVVKNAEGDDEQGRDGVKSAKTQASTDLEAARQTRSH